MQYFFPSGSAPVPSTHTADWNLIWSQQALGKTYLRGSIGSRLKHNHFNSCSHNALVPSDNLALDKHKEENKANFSCFCAELQIPTWVTQVCSDYIGLTCFSNSPPWQQGTRGNRALSNPTPGASTPTTGEQTLPQQGCASHREKGRPCLRFGAASGHHNTNCTHYQGDHGWHTTQQASIPKTALTQKYWVHIVYTELLIHKNSPSKP